MHAIRSCVRAQHVHSYICLFLQYACVHMDSMMCVFVHFSIYAQDKQGIQAALEGQLRLRGGALGSGTSIYQCIRAGPACQAIE